MGKSIIVKGADFSANGFVDAFLYQGLILSTASPAERNGNVGATSNPNYSKILTLSNTVKVSPGQKLSFVIDNGNDLYWRPLFYNRHCSFPDSPANETTEFHDYYIGAGELLNVSSGYYENTTNDVQYVAANFFKQPISTINVDDYELSNVILTDE